MRSLFTVTMPQLPFNLYPVTFPVTENVPLLQPSASYTAGITICPLSFFNPVFPLSSKSEYGAATDVNWQKKIRVMKIMRIGQQI